MNAYQFYSEGVKEWHLETLWAAVKLPLTQFAVILKGQAAVSHLGNFCRAHILQVNLISVCNQVAAGLLSMAIVPVVLFTWLVRQS